jgi:uncharacterized OsmC-like protein
MTVTYEGDLRCCAEHLGTGTVLLTDAPKDNLGQGESFSPSDLLSVSLGSSILSIMAIAARSMDTEIVGATAKVTKVMADAPRRIASISCEVRVPGSFNASQRRKLEAAARACPVHHVLGIEAPIKIEWVG